VSLDHPSRAIIDLGALRRNFSAAQRLAGAREVIAVVKADAYGHGAVPVARCLAEAGCGRFAVVTVDEASELRAAGIASPLLVIGGLSSPREAAQAIDHDLVPVLHHAEGRALAGQAARSAGRPLRVQVEVDTGMRRMGVPPDAAAAFLAEVAGDEALILDGVYTHFACADDPGPEPTLAQIALFRSILAEAREAGVDPGLVHADNSAALELGAICAEALPEAGAVRPGLLLYGARSHEAPVPGLALEPVMSVRTRVAAVREMRPGDTVGYGATHRFDRDTRLATLPIGYADGVPRSLSSRGAVWLAGARRPIVGRVSMDWITVDVGDAKVAVGDEATFFGRADGVFEQADGVFGRADETETGSRAGDWPGIAVEDAARAAGTLAYELMVRVGGRIVREVVEGGD
jgi:alanine racemase